MDGFVVYNILIYVIRIVDVSHRSIHAFSRKLSSPPESGQGMDNYFHFI